jgi:hypothetical protein
MMADTINQEKDDLPPKEFEALAQQMPVPWTWRTLRALRDQALIAADGVAHDAVKDAGGRRVVMLLCITNPEQINRIERVLGVAVEADPSRDWERATLFETALRTALEGGFTYESMRGEGGARTAIALCAAGQKGMRVIESFFPRAGTAGSPGIQDQGADEYAQAEAGEIIARLALPEDIRGRTIHFVTFASDRDCEFFHPGRTREQHERIFAAVQARLFSRGVQFARSPLTPEMFAEAGRQAGEPTNWAERRTFLVPSARNPKTSPGQTSNGPVAVV